MTQYAITQTQVAYLSTEFGLALALRKFAPITEDQLATLMGRYTRGARKGLIRGRVEWTKCTTGGWVKTGGRGDGHVCRPGSFGYKLLNAGGAAILAEPGDYCPGQFRVTLLAALHGPDHPEVKLARKQEQLVFHDGTKDDMLKDFCIWRNARQVKNFQGEGIVEAAMKIAEEMREDARYRLSAWFRVRRNLKAELKTMVAA